MRTNSKTHRVEKQHLFTLKTVQDLVSYMFIQRDHIANVPSTKASVPLKTNNAIINRREPRSAPD